MLRFGFQWESIAMFHFVAACLFRHWFRLSFVVRMCPMLLFTFTAGSHDVSLDSVFDAEP